MKNLVIIGVGGFARVVYGHTHDSLGYGEEWNVKGFLDGDVKLAQNEYDKLPASVLGDVNNYEIQEADVFVCAIANPAVKKKLVETILNRGGKFINIIHKTAIIHKTVILGVGNIIAPYCMIYDSSKLGDHIMLNSKSILGHDVEIGDFSTLLGDVNINGRAKVGECSCWGAGSIALPQSVIEDNAFVGVGSVVFRHVKKGQKVFGNPAMPMYV